MIAKYAFRQISLDLDINSIYSVVSNPNEQYNLNTVINANTIERYRELLCNRLRSVYEDFTIIEVDNTFAGFVAAYDYLKQWKHIKALIYIVPQYRGGSLGLVGIQYMHWMFNTLNVDKVYTEVYSYNARSIKFHSHFGFVEEGRLTEYRYLNGKYWDVIYYGMSRDVFFHKYAKIINRFFK